MQVETWPIGRLIDYARNPRKNDHAVDRVASAIREFGFRVPVIAKSDGSVIDGHLRLKAARKLELETVPVVVADDLTPAQVRAFRISVNRMAELAQWDNELLLLEFLDLREEGFDLELTGFDDDEIAAILAEPKQGLTDPDDVPAIDEAVVTQAGDIWTMGRHRLLCGDSTDAAGLERMMEGARADLLFTSPPYSQQRDYGAAKDLLVDWQSLMQGVFGAAPVAEDAQILVNLGLIHRDNEWVPYWDGWIAWMREQGWRRFGWYVWDQGPGLPGDWNGRAAPSHEFIFHFNRIKRAVNKTVASKHAGKTLGGGGLRGADGTVHRKTGTGNAIQSHRIPDSVFRAMRHKGGLGDAGSHPAVFSVEFAQQILDAFSGRDALVFEPFGGSGTTMLAAEMTGRVARLVELEPAYCDVAIRRWQAFTGETATRQDGATFAEAAGG